MKLPVSKSPLILLKNVIVRYQTAEYFFLIIIILIAGFLGFRYEKHLTEVKVAALTNETKKLAVEKSTLATELKTVTSEDQFVKNNTLQSELKQINSLYMEASSTYEQINDLKLKEKTDAFDKDYALVIKQLSDKNYASAEATFNILSTNIKKEQDKIAAAQVPVTSNNIPAVSSNTPPGSGFSRQSVHADIGDFTMDIIAADLGSTRVIVDTASDSDCTNNCPVLSLGDYVNRNGAFAGINGSYFCPESYPTCAGKTNSFDLLAMNKNKHYINSDNNVYSTNPAVIFQSGSIRFVSQALQWGRDTGVDGVLSNYPLLLSGNNIRFNGDGDPKKGGKGSRSFVANKGNTVYIGVVYNATVAEAAHALKALGLDNALNLDSGGSVALWSGGYKAGPGRNIPNAILFVRK
jgi:hypothetical protein